MRSRLLHQPARLAGASLLRLQSDDRLADLAVAGHETAFAAIVHRYRAPLTRYCAGIVGADRAEDVVQQALINAHLALTPSSDVRHLRAWLFKIAHNTALNTLRAVRDDLPLDPAQALTADGPEATLERRERLRATLAAVERLPERQRAALLLRELEGRSHDEIADALGVTAGAARQHLMRARAAVRGAVTAITPYPLVARLAEAMTAGPPPWADAVAGAGAGATIAKLTAGVAATGALVGGVVGTSHVVGPRDATGSLARGGAAATVRVQEGARNRPAAAATIIPVAAARGGLAVSEPEIHRKAPGHGGAEDGGGGSSGRGHEDDDGNRGGTSRGSDDDGSRSGTSHRDEDDHGGDRGHSGTSGRGEGGDDEHVVAPTKSSGSGTSGSGSGTSGSGSSTSGSGSGKSGSGGGDDAAREDSSGSGSGREPDDGGSSGSGDGDSAGESSSSGPGSGTVTTAPVIEGSSGRDGGGSGGGSSGPGSGSSLTVPPAPED
jgi:RNA polymerase sigma factor (sigma-70 family)